MAFTSKYLNVTKDYTLKIRKKQAKGLEGVFCNSPVSLKLAKSSDNLLAKCASPIIKKKKQMVGVLNELQGDVNRIKRCNLAFRLLNLCAETDGVYAKEIGMVVGVVRDALFVYKDKIDSEVLSQIYDENTEAIFSSESIPSFCVMEALSTLLKHYKSENFSLSSQNQKLSSDLKLMLREKDSELTSLRSYINSNLTEPLNQKNAELGIVEEQYLNACKSIDELKEIIETNEIIIRKLRQQNSNHTKTIYNYQCEEEKLKYTIEDLNKKVTQLNKDIKDMQEENYKKQYYLEITLMKVKASIDREKFFESRNAELESENEKLSQIYKNGSQFLTPRPSFSAIEDFFTSDQKSSYDKVKKLINFTMRKLPRKSSQRLFRRQYTTLTPRKDIGK